MVSCEEAEKVDSMMTDEESRLNALLEAYRAACPDIEPGPGFMPAIWQGIEARRSFWLVFQREARAMVTACAAIFVVLLALNVFSGVQNRSMPPSYADALMADHTAEQTYYAEAIRGGAPAEVSGFSRQ
jgi:hypothetical protein